MSKDINNIIINNGFLPNPSHKNIQASIKKPVDLASYATLVANFVSYGYIPSVDMLDILMSLNKSELSNYWKIIEPSLKNITGDDLNIEEHILYKNFPKEVLDTPHALYWLKQFFVYLGVDYDFVREAETQREKIDITEINPKVLHKAPDNVFEKIYQQLIAQKNRWNTEQEKEIDFIVFHIFDTNNFIKNNTFSLSNFGFKENGLTLIKNLYVNHKTDEAKDFLNNLFIKDATDILRLAAILSDQDVSLRENIKFKNFKRFERRAFINKLNNTNNLDADIAARPELFKKLFAKIHPNDYKADNVKAAYNKLYKNQLKSFNSEVEKAIKEKNEGVLGYISTQPGQYVRQFHHLYEVFGDKTLHYLEQTLPELNLMKIVQFKKYIETINDRKKLIFAPKGQWHKAQISDNYKIKIKDEDKNAILLFIDNIIQEKLSKKYPEGFDVHQKTKEIKLQTNDQKLADYGRGTVFDIPKNINFIRTSSFWDINEGAFLDNTWNFFDENWNPSGVCCWNREKLNYSNNEGAVFSGDTVNQKNGKAAQLIDIYLDQLQSQGIKYAVWSSLSFSNIPFNQFSKAHMGLQMGEDAQKGRHFDPARVTLAFPLTEESKSKAIAYINIPERKIIYMDVNFSLNIQSGVQNEHTLSGLMPAYVEYLHSLPSVYDILATHPGSIPAVYSDENTVLQDNKKAYVFINKNENNNFEKININEVIEEENNNNHSNKNKVKP